jgi:tetratricopeptide (TPR) repeat protein
MLASLLGVPVAVIRRWRRRGLITPTREVRKLPYFDYQQVAAARRLAELLAAGVSPRAIERKLAALARLLPGVERPLAQLSIIVEGRQLLLRQGDGLIEPGGQLRLDFGAWEANEREACRMDQEAAEEVLSQTAADEDAGEAESPDRLLSAAEQLEDDGQLEAAVGMYRAALMADGPRPEVCFQLAELLYRMGDVTAACERYYVAVELDEDYVEARANLGCVLAELGQLELAVAAFEGALAYHHEYPDVHYHLARTLAELGRRDQAARHWRRFLELAPDSPWAAEARQQVE